MTEKCHVKLEKTSTFPIKMPTARTIGQNNESLQSNYNMVQCSVCSREIMAGFDFAISFNPASYIEANADKQNYCIIIDNQYLCSQGKSRFTNMTSNHIEHR